MIQYQYLCTGKCRDTGCDSYQKDRDGVNHCDCYSDWYFFLFCPFFVQCAYCRLGPGLNVRLKVPIFVRDTYRLWVFEMFSIWRDGRLLRTCTLRPVLPPKRVFENTEISQPSFRGVLHCTAYTLYTVDLQVQSVQGRGINTVGIFSPPSSCAKILKICSFGRE